MFANVLVPVACWYVDLMDMITISNLKFKEQYDPLQTAININSQGFRSMQYECSMSSLHYEENRSSHSRHPSPRTIFASVKNQS